MARLRELNDPEKAQAGVPLRFTESDLIDHGPVRSAWRDLLTVRSTESAKYFWGHGERTRNDPNLGYMYFAPAVGSLDINGTVRFVVYADSEGETPIVGPSFRTEVLRDAVGVERTERPSLPLYVPGAGKDNAIALQFKSDDFAEGFSFVAEDWDVSIPYTQVLE